MNRGFMARVRRTARAADDGTTLAELLVSMMIFGVVVAAVATLTIGFTRVNGQNIARQDQIDVARTSSERMAKVLRTAVKPNQLTGCKTAACASVDAFVAGTASSIQFYANLNNQGNVVGPSRVTYTVAATGADAGVLIEKVQVPDPWAAGTTSFVYCDAETGAPSADCKARLTVRRLATGVITSSAAPLFSYIGGTDGQEMTPAGGALSAAQIDDVIAIELALKIKIPSPTKPGPTTYIQRIQLPNTQAVLRPGDVTP